MSRSSLGRLAAPGTAWLLVAPLALQAAGPVSAQGFVPNLRHRPDQAQLAQARGKIPAEIQALEAHARELYGRNQPQQAFAQMEQVMAWAKSNLPPNDPFRASGKAWIGLLLSKMGRYQEALGPTEEAVNSLRELAKANPTYLDSLAIVLTSLSSYYNELRSQQQALSPSEEAVSILRKRSKTNPKQREHLALALTNLGAIYRELGRPQEALPVAQEAVLVYAELVKTDPAFQGRLSLAGDNLATIRLTLGHPQGWITAEETVKKFEELAKTDPSHRGDLAHARINLGAHYSRQGRVQEALAITEKGVQSYRELAQANPDYRDDLARSLYNLGAFHFNLDRPKDALASTQEAILIYKELAQANPGYLNNLAKAITNLGFIQQQLGQSMNARQTFEAALTVTRSLTASDPVVNRIQQRSQNNLDELNRQEGIRKGEIKVVAASDASNLPPADPNTPLKRAVVRLWPTFVGTDIGVGTIGTGFVVRRQGDKAWIATALHVVRDLDGGVPAKKVEAELYTGPLPQGSVPPRLEVVISQLPEGADRPILLEVRGLPADIQALPLAKSLVQGSLTVVGHPSDRDPWTVVTYSLMKSDEKSLLLDGGLDPGASGSPVLSASRQVVGLVHSDLAIGPNQPFRMCQAFSFKLLFDLMMK